MKILPIEKLIKDTKSYYVNSNLTSANFPIPKKIETEGGKMMMIDRPMSSEEVLEKMKKEGLRPATVYELAHWILNEKNIPRNKYYVAFGSQWTDAAGDRRVPFVCVDSVGGFGWYLGCFEGVWTDGIAFFGFRDSTLELSTLETKNLDILNLETRVSNIEKWIKGIQDVINK